MPRPSSTGLRRSRPTPPIGRRSRDAAATIRARAADAVPASVPVASIIALLERLVVDPTSAAGLEFQGSYTQPAVKEPVYGGHATSMGPPPTEAPRPSSASPVTFEEVPAISTKTYCGGPHEGSHPRIRRQRRRARRLRRRRPARHLSRDCVRAVGRSARRSRIATHCSETRAAGRFETSRRARGWTSRPGATVSARATTTTTARSICTSRTSVRTFSSATTATARSPTAPLRPASRRRAGAPAARFSTRTPTETWTSMSRATSTRAGRTFPRAQRTLVWRGGPKTMTGPKGMPGEADLFFENRGDGTFVEAAEAHGLVDAARGYGYGVLATDYDADGWVDLFVANDTTPNFLYRNLRRRTVRERRPGQRCRAQRRGTCAGRHGRRLGRLRRRRPPRPRRHQLRARREHALSESRWTAVRGRHRGRRARGCRRSCGWAGARRSSMPISMAPSISSSPTATSIPTSTSIPELQETFRQKNQLLVNRQQPLPRRVGDRGRGLQVAKSSRGLAVGDLDNDGDLDLVVSNMDEAPTVLENRQQTGHHWVGVQLAKPGANRFCIGARVTVDCRWTPAGARDSIRRRLSVAERPACVLWTWHARRHGRRGGPDAWRRHVALAGTADRSSAHADARRQEVMGCRSHGADSVSRLDLAGLLAGAISRAGIDLRQQARAADAPAASHIGSLYPFVQRQADHSPLELSFLRPEFSDLAAWQSAGAREGAGTSFLCTASGGAGGRRAPS